MKRFVLLTLGLLVGLSGLVLAQERQRLFVVRDDDGTADAGRGQVSGPPYV